MSLKSKPEKIEKTDVANIEDIPLIDNLVCPIDSMIPFHPLMCSKCQTIFCEDCLEKWNERSKACPLRCKPFVAIPVDSLIIHQQLESIKFKCENFEVGCKKMLKYEEKEEHEKICPYKKKNCNFCNELIYIKEFEAHYLNSCSFFYINCVHCKEKVHLKDLYGHVKKCKQKNFIKCFRCMFYHFNKNDCELIIGICQKCKLPDILTNIKNNEHKCCNDKTEATNIKDYYLSLIKEYEINAKYQFELFKENNDKICKKIEDSTKLFTRILKGQLGEIEINLNEEQNKKSNLIEKKRRDIRKENERLKKEIDNIQNKVRNIEIEYNKVKYHNKIYAKEFLSFIKKEKELEEEKKSFQMKLININTSSISFK